MICHDIRITCDNCGDDSVAMGYRNIAKARKDTEFSGWIFSRRGEFCGKDCSTQAKGGT